jgi:AbrB family looped-hinge helix DNA binding protein
MGTTIDSAGRVVIPKHIRDQVGLHGGDEIEIGVEGGIVTIGPRRVGLVVEHIDGRPVLRAPKGTPRMTAEDVRDLIEQIRR